MTSISLDELTSTVCGAVQPLTQDRKANLLLDAALTLINAGRYGPEVENCFDVYLRKPGITREDMYRALVARGSTRKRSGEALLVKAQEDFQTAMELNPENRDVQQHLWRKIRSSNEHASQRAPLEIWERIASHTPRYHLRTWLFISPFHRDIAVRHIFHTVDIYFGDDQPENLNRGLDIFDHAKNEPVFASSIKSLRLHWAYKAGEMLDLMTRLFKTALPEFKALRHFEWIGYPEMREDMVQAILASHKHLHGLGLIGWHFDAIGISVFRNLRNFTLCTMDDSGFADIGDEVRTVLDANEHTLRHLILGAHLERQHSWDFAFQSVTIKNLTHLDLVSTCVSQVVLARIAHAHNLQSLTLHGVLEEPALASVAFGSDHVIDGKHTFLPHLESFRFLLVGQDDERALYHSVTQFLRQRQRLRRLDLGSCPLDMVLSLLPDLSGLRVLGVRIANVGQTNITALIGAIPEQMLAINLSASVSEKPLNEYAHEFSKFAALAFLHLRCPTKQRPGPILMSEKDVQVQTDMWVSSVRGVATAIPSLDFLGWHGEHYAIVRSDGSSGVYGSGSVELKELPMRRHLDCAKGVDLGGEDAAWLEYTDVPIDYEMLALD